MSRKIFLDVEEAIGREVRRISYHEPRTVDKVVFKETFDPFTGDVIQRPIEPNFYDSSADAGVVTYPHFFIRLLRTKEDRTTGRVTPQYGKLCPVPQVFSPGAFEIIISGSDATIDTVGNTLKTGIFQIAKVQPGHLLRILTGNNKGTYIVGTIIKDALGNHEIIVTNDIVQNMPAFTFSTTTRTISFTNPVDLNTVAIADIFTDNSANTFNVVTVDPNLGQFTIDGTISPDTTSGGSITRSGNVFTSTDLTNVRYLIMDPTKPVTALSGGNKTSTVVGVDPEVPLDAYYLIRIDSKEKDDHTMVLNRMWEEFNPPRTALPTIRRTALSAEGLLTEDIPSGGSTIFKVTEKDASEMKVGEPVFIFDDISPSKRSDGEGFERPFETTIIGKPSSTEIEVADIIPDTYLISNCTKAVTNAEFRLYMFHLEDHQTKDVEGAQYWVHEFIFWVQIWIDRQGEGKKFTTITDARPAMEDAPEDGNTETNFVYDENC